MGSRRSQGRRLRQRRGDRRPQQQRRLLQPALLRRPDRDEPARGGPASGPAPSLWTRSDRSRTGAVVRQGDGGRHPGHGDASLDSVQVLFYDGDPQQGGEAFDAELISHIRANDSYMTKVKFQPRTCGQHTVVVVAGQQTAYAATGTATVDVAIDPVTSVAELITATTSFALPKGFKQSLLARLDAAKKAFARGRTTAALHQLNAFINEVQEQRGHKLTTQQADQLLDGAQLILGCV